MPCFMEKHKREWAMGLNAFHLVGCICSRWTTMALRLWLRGHGGAVPVLEMESACRPRSWLPHLQSPFAQKGVKTSSRGNHLTHFHPISTAECVHFQANGMSFCWSLWSRINPGIKTDFPGSNLPSSIDFFTLTEPVLPNLTWQPAAQWTGSTLASHRGSAPPPPPLFLSPWSERAKKKDSQMYKTKSIAYRKHSYKLPSLSFTLNYVF